MKLWQKIFLISLLLVMPAVSVTAIVVAQSYFSMMIRTEKEAVMAQHAYISSSIVNNVTFEKMRSSQFYLSDEQIKNTISDCVSRQATTDGILLCCDKEEITAFLSSAIYSAADFVNKVKDCGQAYSTITEYLNEEYLIVGSNITLDGNTYYVFTSHNISYIYISHTQSLDFIKIISMGFAIVTSAVLLLLVSFLLRPLRRINSSISTIAEGVYSARIEEKGGAEFKELAHNINIMADAIEENIDELQNIADSRKRFVDNFAHEMKTPLTSIICLADILRIKKDLTNSETLEYSGIIAEEAKRLKVLSHKILELTVAGNAKLEFTQINIAELLYDIKVIIEPVLKKNDISLTVVSVEATIYADKELFTSLLLNLIDNAIKASSPKSLIEVISVLDNEELTVSVIDHGVGMSKDELKRITEPFYMVDKSRSRKSGGAGLGLALCAEIVRKHNARMKFESLKGEGTTVSIIIHSGGRTDEKA